SITPSMAFTVWGRIIDGILATCSNLMARGISLPSYNCPFCWLDIEDINHVLISCQKVCGIWKKVRSWWNLPPPTSFASLPVIELASGNDNVHGDANLSKATNGVLQISIWTIWNWRNRRIHATGDDIDAIKNEDIFP
nr:hypothetical protein [Tanacetum cinerariifolium]